MRDLNTEHFKYLLGFGLAGTFVLCVNLVAIYVVMHFVLRVW